MLDVCLVVLWSYLSINWINEVMKLDDRMVREDRGVWSYCLVNIKLLFGLKF